MCSKSKNKSLHSQAVINKTQEYIIRSAFQSQSKQPVPYFLYIALGLIVVGSILVYVLSALQEELKYNFYFHLDLDTSWVAEKKPVYFINRQNLDVIHLDGSGLKQLVDVGDDIAECRFSKKGEIILTSADNNAAYIVTLATGQVQTAASGIVGLNDWGTAKTKRFGPLHNVHVFSYPGAGKISVSEYVYYTDPAGNKKKIFKNVPSEAGDPDIRNLRWYPGGKYVVCDSSVGILVIEPATGRYGKLIKGSGFGWFEEPSA